MNLRLSPFLLGLLVAGGCAVGPDFKAPSTPPVPAFRGAEVAGTNSLGDLPWWQLFQDSALQELVHIALTNSYDLRVAATRVEQSRALLAQSRSVYFPQVTYQAGVGAGKNVVGGVPYYTGSGSGKGNDIAGSVSWEIDLWGRIRRLNESARGQFLATEEARREVTVSLVANVAQSYFQLLALDEELAIAKEATNSFSESLRLFNERLQGGVSSKLESAAAEAALASSAATIPELHRQIVIQENQLRVLLGLNPGPVVRRAGGLREQVLPEVPAGLPSALLERRPDIRRATQLMRAANAQVGLATANFYPHITLTGLFGQVSPELVPFTSGAVTTWSLAANLAGPIFQGGLLKAQLRQARAAWDQACLEYEATILNAFQEVSNALVSRQELASERYEQARAVAAYQVAVGVANERYRGGQASYYELLQEQQQLFPAETALTQTHLNQLLSTVQLYKALGGGWNTVSP